MKNATDHKERICPHCGCVYTAVPAVSRADNETLICPSCGIREALDSIGIKPDEAERILDIIRRHSQK